MWQLMERASGADSLQDRSCIEAHGPSSSMTAHVAWPLLSDDDDVCPHDDCPASSSLHAYMSATRHVHFPWRFLVTGLSARVI